MTIFARPRAALAAGWGALSVDRYHIVARHSNTALMCPVRTMLIAGTGTFAALQFPGLPIPLDYQRAGTGAVADAA